MEGKRFAGIDLGKRSYEACAVGGGSVIERWNGKADGSGRKRLASYSG